MKFFLAVFTIALVAQLSFGASIQRFEREAEVKPNAWQAAKSMIFELKSMLAAVLKDLPDSDNYRQYEQELLDLLSLYGEKDDGLCEDKMAAISESFSNFGVRLEKDDDLARRVSVSQLFLKHGLTNFLAKYRPENISSAEYAEADYLSVTC